MGKAPGERGKEGETRSKLFEYICQSPEGVETRAITEYSRDVLDIWKKPDEQLAKLEKERVIVKKAPPPAPEKTRSGKPTVWMIADDPEPPLRYLFETFGNEPERLINVYNSPGIQNAIDVMIDALISAQVKVNIRFFEQNPTLLEEGRQKYTDDEIFGTARRVVYDALHVSPSFLRWMVSGEKPPEFILAQWLFVVDLVDAHFALKYTNQATVTNILAFFGLDLVKYPNQVKKILDFVKRDDFSEWVTKWDPQHENGLYKIMIFADYIRSRDSRFKILSYGLIGPKEEVIDHFKEIGMENAEEELEKVEASLQNSKSKVSLTLTPYPGGWVWESEKRE
jgi:hypothetical protein